MGQVAGRLAPLFCYSCWWPPCARPGLEFSQLKLTHLTASATTAVVCLSLIPAAHSAGGASTAPTSKSGPPQAALLNQYCTGCHNEKLKTGGIAIDSLDVAHLGNSAASWEKVLRKLRTGEMPPPRLPRPKPEENAALVSWLETGLDQAAAQNPNPGRPAIHRLNRAEYSNAIRDLLALDIAPGATLPADDSGYGFDNIGDVLTVSPILMEKYMSVARKVSRLAVGDISLLAGIEQYNVPAGLAQDDRTSEDLPFGSRGGMAVRHHFPLDAEYNIRVHVRQNAFFGGGGAAPELDIRLDGARVKLFTVKPGGNADDQGIYDVRIPVKAGTRTVGVTFLKETVEPEGILIPRTGRAAAAFGRPTTSSLDYIQVGGPFNPTGAGETPSRDRIFTCHPAAASEEAPCATKILSTLARHAYRRPVTATDLKPLLDFYAVGRKKGSFESGIQLALERMLVSPNFLFRAEHTDTDKGKVGQAPSPANSPNAPVSQYDLAARLSFFLWSSIPDDELLTLASQNKLRDPGVLEHQVRRMLADPRSQALVTNFAGQWLYLRNLSLVKPDPDAFPEFDESLRQSFQEETELFFADVLREDRSVVDLLDANFTFLNERLAKHYDIPNVHGSHFRRVTLTDPNRGGLLGQGAILTVTSYPTRTSPVLRGKWILENLLGTPPPPPPANVPDLKAKADDGRLLSLREQMEKHRANATCASCHARMDPLGFSLENFDGVGKWRAKENGGAIDTSGVLPNGTKFEGPSGLKKILLGRREEFVGTATEKLLTYALGRGLEYYDEPVIRSIERDAARDDYKLSALIIDIVKSTPFQMRRIQDNNDVHQ